jgi:paraquat-inducible protein A
VSVALATALSLDMTACHDCGLLAKLRPSRRGQLCPRCGARLHSRRVGSIRRAWALVAAAAILYVPANVLPIMTTTSLGYTQSDTIMSGVIYLLKDDWPLAVIVFVASVMVPIMKLVVLGYLLYSVQTGSRARPRDRTRLYRIIEAVGRWSMVDIYVVTISVALVRLDALASVEAELGAVFFGGVVVLTIIAAECFDPRLIWDRADPSPSFVVPDTGAVAAGNGGLDDAMPEGSTA